MRRVLLLVVCLLCQLAEAHFPTEFPVVSFMGEALPNHTYLDITLVGRRSQGREPLLCHTDLNSCCSSDQGPVHRGDWYFPSGVNAGTTNEKNGKMKVSLLDVDSQSGMYRCDIPTTITHNESDALVRETVYVGLYSNGGQVVITGMTLIVDSDLNGASPQFTLTCTSTGGPATTVTWTRDSVTVTERSKTVLEDPITAQYTHNLTVTGRLGGLYTCSVSNNMPFTVNESFTVKVASAPTMLLAIQEGPTSVRVSWNSAVLQEDIKGYRLVYSNGGESISVNVSSDQTGSYLVTGLHNGEIYDIIFESISQHFNTNSSLNVPMVPGQPSVSIATIILSATSISPFWSVPQGSVVMNYIVTWERNTSVGCSNVDMGSTTINNSSNRYDISQLEEDSHYLVTVRASNSAGTSEISTITQETPEAAPSAAPDSVRVTENSLNSITVHWMPVECIHRNGDITGYSVEYEDIEGPAQYLHVSNSRVNISELHVSTNYSIRVAAVNMAGVGVYSSPLVATTDDTVSISASTSSTSLDISIRLMPGATATSYTISYSNINYTDCFADSNTTDIIDYKASHTLNDLHEGTEYDIIVNVTLGDGRTAEDSLLATTLTTAPSAPPRNVNVSLTTSTTITVQWSEVDCIHRNGDIKGYSVRYRVAGSVSAHTVLVSTMEAIITSLILSNKYYIEVAATNAGGLGVYSDAILVNMPTTSVYLTLNGKLIVNHGYVLISDIGSTDDTALICNTDRPTLDHRRNSGGEWYAPDETRVHREDVPGFTRNRGPMRARLRRYMDTDPPAEGLYHCTIEDSTFILQNIFVGLYNTGQGNATIPAGIMLSNDSDLNGLSPQFTLTCISTGGPATTVTWTRDSVTVTEGMETVLDDPGTAQYTHTLAVAGRLGGLYTCTVSNDMPSEDSESLTVKVASVPTDMKTVQDRLTNVRVSWRPPTTLGYTTGYTMMYSNGNNTESVEINNESTDNYLLTGLVPENSYNISLIATSQHLTSNIITKHIKLVPLPGQPVITMITAMATSISLTWSAPRHSVVMGSEVAWQVAGSRGAEENKTSGSGEDIEIVIIITDMSYTVMFNASANYSITVSLINVAGRGVASQPIIFSANAYPQCLHTNVSEADNITADTTVGGLVAVTVVLIILCAVTLTVIVLLLLRQYRGKYHKKESTASPNELYMAMEHVEAKFEGSDTGDTQTDYANVRYSTAKQTEEEKLTSHKTHVNADANNSEFSTVEEATAATPEELVSESYINVKDSRSCKAKAKIKARLEDPDEATSPYECYVTVDDYPAANTSERDSCIYDEIRKD